MNRNEALRLTRIIGLIIFNIGIGSLTNINLFPSKFYHFLIIFLMAFFGNVGIVLLTEES